MVTISTPDEPIKQHDPAPPADRSLRKNSEASVAPIGAEN